MAGRASRAAALLRWLAALLVADLVVSAALWATSPLFFRQWDGACWPDTTLVVFFGGENSHTGSRVRTAAEALKACPELRAMLVGGARPERGFFGSEEMMRQLVEAGNVETRLVSERRSFDSPGNIEAMFSLADLWQPAELVLVSDPLHVLRLAHIAGEREAAARYRLTGLAAWPREDPLAFWWRPHYEAAAWVAQMMPRGLYGRIVALIRS